MRNYADDRRKKPDKQGKLLTIGLIAIIILCLGIGYFTVKNEKNNYINEIIGNNGIDQTVEIDNRNAEQIITEYADEHNLSLSDYPQSLIDLLDRNKEAKDFVLSYPQEKSKKHRINMQKYENCDTVPLFMQWDKRWGYMQYGNDVAGLTACGPVCLSMVATYLLQDTDYSPDYMIQWAIDNGYCVEGSGSLWTLISEGGEQLGMDVTELPLDKGRIIDNLTVGNPIICIMGPGDFTTKGHFIVMTGYENGKIRVNDPNSVRNSEDEWDYDEISDQIQNLWAFRVID